MPKERRPHDPLPNWRDGMTADEYVSQQDDTEASPEKVAKLPEPFVSPSEKPDPLIAGVTPEWMRMTAIRREVQRKWGTNACNARIIEAETRRRYLTAIGEGLTHQLSGEGLKTPRSPLTR